MGDLASSLFALGYHEEIDNTSQIPNYVAELRKAAVARIYTADKSLAIFLGRPPRIIKAYCNFRIPSNIPELWDVDNTVADPAGNPLAQETSDHDTDMHAPRDDEMINHTADTRCAAMFASLKEEILALFR